MSGPDVSCGGAVVFGPEKRGGGAGLRLQGELSENTAAKVGQYITAGRAVGTFFTARRYFFTARKLAQIPSGR
jgi:hypothetical protein